MTQTSIKLENGVTFPALEITPAQQNLLITYLNSLAKAAPVNTVKAMKSDILKYEAFCEEFGYPALPTTLEAAQAFIKWRAAQKVKSATISRALTHLAQIHDVLELDHPLHHRFIKLDLKAIRRKDRPAKQATPIHCSDLQRWEAIEFLGQVTKNLVRDAALLWVGYDALMRSEELTRIQISWIEFLSTGEGLLTLPFHKTDQEAEGSVIYLSAHTVDRVKAWMELAGISGGALFRSYNLKGSLRGSISPSGVNDIIQFRGAQMGLDGVSSHSLRIGATQDLIEADATNTQIMLAGRWKSDRMPALYGRKIAARKSAMSKLARQQGRTRKDLAEPPHSVSNKA